MENFAEKKQKLYEKSTRAQQKWIQLCELCGKEYIDLQNTMQEIQKEAQKIDEEEKANKKTPK